MAVFSDTADEALMLSQRLVDVYFPRIATKYSTVALDPGQHSHTQRTITHLPPTVSPWWVIWCLADNTS